MSQWFYCIEILKEGNLQKDSGIFPSDGVSGYDTPKAALDAILWQFREFHPDAELTVVNLNRV